MYYLLAKSAHIDSLVVPAGWFYNGIIGVFYGEK